MLPHLLRFLARVFFAMPSRISGNWTEVFFGIGIFVLAELLTIKIRGWKTVKTRWVESLGIGTAAVAVGWVGLFLYSIILGVAEDHQSLANRNGELVRNNRELAEKNSHLVDPKSRDDEIAGLRKKLGDTKGTSQEPLHILIRYYGLEHETHVNDKTGQVIFVEGLTNKKISPIDVVVSCNQDFLPMNQPHVGIGGIYLYSELNIINRRAIRVKLGSPAWTPETPLGIPIFTEAKDIECQLKLNGR